MSQSSTKLAAPAAAGRPGLREARSRATVQRLLDATVEALVECGYAGTTTQEVCRRAGAPRGTLLHHFGTRTELLVAALDHVLAARVEEFEATFAELQPGDDRASQVIDLLWSNLTGPTFYAWLELAVAGRCDTALREALVPVMQRFEVRTRETFDGLFPDAAANSPFAELAPGFVFAVLNSLALDRIYKSEEQVEPLISALKLLGGLVE